MDSAVAEGGAWFGDRQAQFPAGGEIPVESDFAEGDDNPNWRESLQFLHKIGPTATKFIRQRLIVGWRAFDGGRNKTVHQTHAIAGGDGVADT